MFCVMPAEPSSAAKRRCAGIARRLATGDPKPREAIQ
jgi:hypothetical protein